LACFILPGYGQTASLQGVINHYASISAIYGVNENDVDSVLVTSLPTEFGEGDTVMVYCVKGAEIEMTDVFGEENIGKVQNPRYAGKYAFLIIDQIIGNTVVLNTTMRPEIGPLTAGEVAQLIRVPSYRRAEVTGTVTAPAWDGATGGVVAMFVTTSLVLEADINVNAKGLRGAVEPQIYSGTCSSVDTTLYDSTFYHISNVKAGIKGEGITYTQFDMLRGKAMNINGGGGGNAKFSGGGGGSNYSSGGKGGNESSDCPPGLDAPGGAGGYALHRTGESYYLNYTEVTFPILNLWNRIFFGGGGGTGTLMASRTSTSGGAGGGLVVIVADTIEGNGNRISADGGSVTGNATGAGGGGGGGGGIILDVSGYRDNLSLSAVGGEGGDTNHPTDTTGPGGGGGGGIYWLAGTNEPGVFPQLLQRGQSGEHIPTSVKYGAANGSLAARKNGLEAPLRGFLFNSVPTAFTVCADQVPETILASRPKGGDGINYTYLWVDSSATQNSWQSAPGTNNLQYYNFEGRKLSDTTYFRRIVTSGLLPPDTSFRIAVFVHQPITGNNVTSPDTVCLGNAPKAFLPVGSPGGGLGSGSYTYRWLRDEGSGNYLPAQGSISDPGYQAPGLTTTTLFAREVESGVCLDTSAALMVTVLNTITGNSISPFDTICQNTRPDLITGPVPGGGQPADRRYSWESSIASLGPWTEVAGVTTKDYRPGPLASTAWYHRVVLSGSDDACIDTSSPVEILNIAPITGNSILTAAQTLCSSDQPEILVGSDPGGGYQGLYGWKWQSRTLSSGWIDADETSGNDQKDYLPPVMTGDTTWYRRVVGSGGEARNVCTDFSDSVVVNVLPPLTNNEVLTADEVKCQFDLLDDLTQDPTGGPAPGGGATQGGSDPTRNYKWEQANGQGAPSGAWSEVSYGPLESDYTATPELTLVEDYWYRRILFSGPTVTGQEQACADTSGVIHITIHSAIAGNTIDAADSACYQIQKVVGGALPTGEPGIIPAYVWRDVDKGTELPDSDEAEYAFTSDSYQPYLFQRVALIGACSDTSNSMVINVMQLPGGILSGVLPRACEKDTLLDINLSLDTLDSFITPWEVYLLDGVNPGLIGPYLMNSDGQVEIILETDQDADSTQFNYTLGRILYSSTTGRYECVAPAGNLSGIVPIEVFRRPEPVISVGGLALDSFKVCNTTMSLVADADNGYGLWRSDPPGVFFAPEPSAESVFASIPNDPQSYREYVVTFTSEAGDCAGTDVLNAHFFEQPAPAYAGEDTMIFLINSVQLKANPPTAGLGSWELVSGSGIIADTHAPNTLAYELGLGEENKFRWTVTNGEDEGTCVTSSDVTIVIRNEVKRYSGFSPNGDEQNEYYIMQGLKYADRFTISFFNSLGHTVRTLDEKNIGEIEADPGLISGGLKEDEMVVWDGRANNGNPVPSGTYYYVVEFFVDQEDPITEKVTRTDHYSYKDYVVVARE
jgi:hypothetical protein